MASRQPPPPTSRIPVEFIGRARALRNRIAAAHAAHENRTERLLAPLRPRPGFTPMPRHGLLRILADGWPRTGRFGRLYLLAEFAAPKLRIGEERVGPTRLSLPGWDADADELGISVALRSVTISPPEFCERTMPLTIVGLHALARRYQRGRRDDAAVLRDLASLGRGWRAAVAGGGEFAVEVPGGRWIGTVMSDENLAPVLAVRTFVGG